MGEVKIPCIQEKKILQRKQHFSKQRDKDSLEKSYFKSGKVHQSDISFAIALLIYETLPCSHLFWIQIHIPSKQARPRITVLELLNNSKPFSSFQNFLDFVYPYNN